MVVIKRRVPVHDADPLLGQGLAFETHRTTAGIASLDKMVWAAPALWSAASKGQANEVLQLLADGADVDERGGPTLNTPLFLAAHQGHEGILQILLKHGADTSATDCYGWTPLHRAANRGREAVLNLLIAHGADVSAENNGGETPLLCAACWGAPNEAVVNILLEKVGRTPFHLEQWIRGRAFPKASTLKVHRRGARRYTAAAVTDPPPAPPAATPRGRA